MLRVIEYSGRHERPARPGRLVIPTDTVLATGAAAKGAAAAGVAAAGAGRRGPAGAGAARLS